MIWALHVAATLVMVGVIWFVQVVHYPLMAEVGHDGFAAYEATHVRLTGRVVVPPMLIEAVTAVPVLVSPPAALPPAALLASTALLALAWISTFAVQVPVHRGLRSGFDAALHRRLVATNWLRTAAWSGRAALLLPAVGAAA